MNVAFSEPVLNFIFGRYRFDRSVFLKCLPVVSWIRPQKHSSHDWNWLIEAQKVILLLVLVDNLAFPSNFLSFEQPSRLVKFGFPFQLLIIILMLRFFRKHKSSFLEARRSIILIYPVHQIVGPPRVVKTYRHEYEHQDLEVLNAWFALQVVIVLLKKFHIERLSYTRSSDRAFFHVNLQKVVCEVDSVCFFS